MTRVRSRRPFAWLVPLLGLVCIGCGRGDTRPGGESLLPDLDYIVHQVSDINASGSSNPANFLTAEGTVYFTADDGSRGCELWASDGTGAGTRLVKDIGSNADSSSRAQCPRLLAAIGTTLFFEADDGQGSGLWKSTGAPEGTVLLRRFPYGLGSAGAVGGTVFFGANDPSYGNQLWKSDGTADGTVFLFDSPDGPNAPGGFTAFSGRVYFFGTGSGHLLGLWQTDGTTAGTGLVKWVSFTSPVPEAVEMKGRLFFAADSILWRSDGTPEGTAEVAVPYYGLLAHDLARVGGTLLAGCDSYWTGLYELWKSDGSDSGTTLVRKFVGSGYERGIWRPKLTVVGPAVFFAIDDGVHGDELWKSDGTSEGTILVADINPGPAASRPEHLLALDGALLFSADDGSHGHELWKSDGTSEGTVMIRDISPGSAASSPGKSGWSTVGSVTLFAADDGVTGNELWALVPFLARDRPPQR